jgi:RPA family protein
MEPVSRVFAADLNASSLVLDDGSAPGRRIVISPSASPCTLLYLAGVLLEVNGRKGDLMHARVADPTGAFELQVSGKEPETAELLSILKPPAFITAIAGLRLTGNSIRNPCILDLREIRETDRTVRDSWVIRTGELMFERIIGLNDALSTETCSPARKMVISHYQHSGQTIRDMARMVRGALINVGPVLGGALQAGNPVQDVLGIIRENGGDMGISLDKIILIAQKSGLQPDQVTKAVETLLIEDECYQPSKGVIKLL